MCRYTGLKPGTMSCMSKSPEVFLLCFFVVAILGGWCKRFSVEQIMIAWWRVHCFPNLYKVIVLGGGLVERQMMNGAAQETWHQGW